MMVFCLLHPLHYIPWFWDPPKDEVYGHISGKRQGETESSGFSVYLWHHCRSAFLGLVPVGMPLYLLLQSGHGEELCQTGLLAWE